MRRRHRGRRTRHTRHTTHTHTRAHPIPPRPSIAPPTRPVFGVHTPDAWSGTRAPAAPRATGCALARRPLRAPAQHRAAAVRQASAGATACRRTPRRGRAPVTATRRRGARTNLLPAARLGICQVHGHGRQSTAHAITAAARGVFRVSSPRIPTGSPRLRPHEHAMYRCIAIADAILSDLTCGACPAGEMSTGRLPQRRSIQVIALR